MEKERKRDKIKKIFQNPYRIVVFNDINLHIIRQVRFNARTALGTLVLTVIAIITGVTILIAFTPLREYIPGYPTGKMRRMLIRNVLIVDSLEQEAQRRDLYFKDFRAMLAGETPADTAVKHIAPLKPEQLQFKSYNHDSLFREEIAQEQVNLGINSTPVSKGGVAGLLFFPPLSGMITGRHDLSTRHFGVDIVGKLNSRISAALDGTVIFAGWTIDTGYVIYLQHEQNLITVYRHNSELLKIQGDKVRAGEAIAIMGNSGKETTGPHLHFEMWLNGVSVNPEEYVKF